MEYNLYILILTHKYNADKIILKLIFFNNFKITIIGTFFYANKIYAN